MPSLPWPDPATLLQGLARQTIVLSVGLLILALLRPLLMRTAGPRAVHAAWIALPLGQLALLLPAASGLPSPALLVLAPPAALQPWRGAPVAAAVSGWAMLLMLGWLAGVLALLLLQWRAHGQVLRQLDRRQQPWRSPAGCSPALIGLWRPRLVLPLDFEQRFTPAEQALVLAHEATHARRGDNAWTLLARLMACLHWFNPLAWWALHRFAQDQELACDALVLQQARAQDLAHYAHALLKAGQAPDAGAAWPALAASWQDCHPLKRRILMLKTHPLHAPHRWRARLGAGLCAVLLTGLGYSVQAQDRKPDPQTIDLRLSIHEGDTLLGQPRLLVKDGQAAAVEFRSDEGPQAGRPLRIGITPQAVARDRYHVVLKLEQGQPLALVAQPRLEFKAGEPIRVDVNAAGRALHIELLARPLEPAPSQKTAAL